MFGLPTEIVFSVLGAVVLAVLQNMGVKIPGVNPKPVDPNVPNVPLNGIDLNGDGKIGPIEKIIEKTLGGILGRLIGKTPEETHTNVQLLLKK